MYSYTLPSTSALDGVGVQRHAPADLPPEKTWYPLYRRLGGPQSRSGRMRKISPAPVFVPRTVQSVASRYTVCAIPAPTMYKHICHAYTGCPKKIVPFLIFFLGAQCVESGVRCTDCY
jgi:hypothetical protein